MTKRKIQESSTDGVSESIGFLLIFTLMMAGIGLVTLYGYPLLMQQQTSADEQIMEKNMIVLQNDIKSLAYKTVPYKETSLKIGGGSLIVYNASTNPPVSVITIYNPATTGPNPGAFVYQFHPGDLRYSSVGARTDISLQNGAVVKRDRAGQGSVMLAEPRWFYDSPSNTMVINLISINSTDIIGRSGIGTVQMVMRESEYANIPLIGGPTILLDYQTPNPDADYSLAWNNYFVNTMKMGSPTQSGNTLTYELPFDHARDATLVIKKYDILIKSV